MGAERALRPFFSVVFELDGRSGAVADQISAARPPAAAGAVETVVLPCGHSTYYEMPELFNTMVADLAASVAP
jgi:hypothetical protein